MKILVVEDDERIAIPLTQYLQKESHRVDCASDGIKGKCYAASTSYDIILLDLMLPRLDGVSLCKQLRAAGSTAMILMLTAKDTTSDRVLGLDAGADDYLVKPFRLPELSARIRALSRRSRVLKPQVFTQGQLELNVSEGRATFNQKTISLTPREFSLLEYFMRHPGQLLSRPMLLEELWGFEEEGSVGAVKTHMTNLRSKLKTAGVPTILIETVYGMGYRLNPLQS